MWLCTETLPHSEHMKVKAQSNEPYREHWTHGNNKASLISLLCMFIHWFQLNYSVHVLDYLSFFKNQEQHGFICQTLPSLSRLCCYGLGSRAMTAFTHNVCALFCKSMVVDVCLLLMYFHDESCFKTFHVSLSELLLLLLDQFHLAKKKEENRE